NEFNAFVGEQTATNNNFKPKQSIVDIMRKKIELDDRASYIAHTVPTDQREYQTEYDEVASAVDKMTIDRYNSAVDKVNEYLESAPDLQEARDNIMTDNVPRELWPALDLLKIGHHNTEN